jgi:hypothetical protein
MAAAMDSPAPTVNAVFTEHLSHRKPNSKQAGKRARPIKASKIP